MLDANNPEINVDEIMARIQEKVRSRRATGDRVPRLNELERPADWAAIDEALAVAQSHAQVGAAVPAMSRTSGLKRLVASFVARIFLRLAQLFTRDQRAFNRAVLDASQALYLQLKDETGRVSRLATQLTQEASVRDQSQARQSAELGAALAEAVSRLDAAQREAQASRTASAHAGSLFQAELSGVRAELAALTAEVREQQRKGSAQGEVAQRLSNLEARVLAAESGAKVQAQVGIDVSRLRTATALQDRRLSLLLQEARKRLPAPLGEDGLKVFSEEAEHLDDSMYLSFEDAFRGSREDVKRLLTDYLPRLRAAKAGTAEAPILDFGCGRGELLEVARDDGLRARGVDHNRASVEVCKQLNLDAVVGDAFEHLAGLPDASLGALTAIHVAEHLPYALLLKLLDEALRVLRPGGLAIFETPNPTNLRVGACTFYLDPSHRNPIHPQTLHYLVEARGFVRVESLMLHPCSQAIHVPEDSVLGRVFNEYFHGPQDYAVLGHKS